MKFSMWISDQRPWDETVARARQADTGGWHGWWYADHYMPNTDDGGVADGEVHECWAVLAAVAAVTERVRLGSLVAPTTVHHPALLAKRAVTIDHISAGRFTLGLGAGWQVNEHTAYGIALPPPGERVERFEEAIQIVASMLGGGRTTFRGRHFTLTDAPCDPLPVQSPLPIMVGTGSARMARITAEHAQVWNTWGHHAEVAERTARFLAGCEKVGRDPSTVWRSVQALVFLVDDQKRVDELTPAVPQDRSLVATRHQLVDMMGRYAEMGVDEFILPDRTLGATAAERAEGYDRFQDEIVAALS